MKQDGLTKNQAEKLLCAALDIGENMLICGGEVNRVEDTITRICKSYNARRVDVLAITTSVVVTLYLDDDAIVTQTRRIVEYHTDFGRLEDLNELSRKICSEHPPVEELPKLTAKAAGGGRKIVLLDYLGPVLVAGSFAVFFGGNVRDGLTAALVALLIVFLGSYRNKLFKGQLVYFLGTSFAAGILAVGLVKLGLGSNVDKVMIGDIMLLIPGIPMTNAIRDVLSGDTISGVLRLFESILITAAIVCGFLGAMFVMGGIA